MPCALFWSRCGDHHYATSCSEWFKNDADNSFERIKWYLLVLKGHMEEPKNCITSRSTVWSGAWHLSTPLSFWIECHPCINDQICLLALVAPGSFWGKILLLETIFRPVIVWAHVNYRQVLIGDVNNSYFFNVMCWWLLYKDTDSLTITTTVLSPWLWDAAGMGLHVEGPESIHSECIVKKKLALLSFYPVLSVLSAFLEW
jgi:hypothetical protein